MCAQRQVYRKVLVISNFTQKAIHLIMGSHGGQFTDSAAKQRVVKEVQFGVLSPDEIVRIDHFVCNGE